MLRRSLQLLLLGCLLATMAVAQRGGHGGGGFHGGGGGFRGGMGGFGGFRGGMGGFGGFRGGFSRGWYGPGWYGRGWGWGLGYPYYGYAGYPYWDYSYPYTYYSYPYTYSYPYAYSYPTYSYPAYLYAPRADSSANTSSSLVQTCQQSDGRPLYQIKLTYQDRVWVARDYWYTPGTLNFVTTQSELNKTPIDSIDRGVTSQLNSACGLNFQFPN